MSNNYKHLMVAGSAMLALMAGERAFAQASESPAASQDGAIEEVVVTARRKEELLQNVPVAVTAVGAQALREQAILQTEDLTRVVPGLTQSASGRGSASPNYMIRGQRGPLLPTSLTDPAVAVYFAEVNQSRSTGTNQSMFDLQSVQVLKGPQGTLFGRNSTAGAILIVPNAPSKEFEGYAQGSFGTFNFRDFEGVLNVPLGDMVAVRAGAKITRRDGYLLNLGTGQRVNDINSESYRLSVALRPADNVESTFIGTYFKSDEAGYVGKFAFVDPRGLPGLPPAFRAIMAQQLQADLISQNALGKYRYYGVPRNPDHAASLVQSIQNTTTVEMGDLTFKNIIGHRRMKNSYIQDFIGSSVDAFYTIGGLKNEQFTEELQVQGKAGDLDYVVGGYYFRETARDGLVGRQISFLSAVAPANFPVYSAYDFDSVATSYAAFAHIDYDLHAVAEGLSLSAGARLTRDRRHTVHHNITPGPTFTPTTFTCALPAPRPVASADRNLCVYDAGVLSTTTPTYDVSLNYQVNPEALVYLAHRRGYRAGSFNNQPQAADLARTSTYNPEYVSDLELGSKTDFTIAGMSGRLNLAAYYQWYSDIQRTVGIQIGSTVSSTTLNAAKAHIWGGEAELTLRPAEGVQITANYALTKPKYDRWLNTYRNAAGVPVQVDVSSSPFSYVSTHQYNVSARFQLPAPRDFGDVSLTASVYGQSKFFTADNGPLTCDPPGGSNIDCLTRQFRVPAYTLVNLRLDMINVADKGFDVGVFVNNVANNYYYNGALNALANLGTVSVGIGAPRMWGLQIRKSFGAMN